MKLKDKGYLVILLGIVLAAGCYVGLVTAKGSSAAIGLVLLLAVVVLGFRRVKHDKDTNYPYRPGIEIRLPDGRITTRG